MSPSENLSIPTVGLETSDGKTQVLSLGGSQKTCRVELPQAWNQALDFNVKAIADTGGHYTSFKGSGHIFQYHDTAGKEVFWQPLDGSGRQQFMDLKGKTSIVGVDSDGETLVIMKNVVGDTGAWFGGMEVHLWKIGSNEPSRVIWKSPVDSSGKDLLSPPMTPSIHAGKVIWMGVEADNPSIGVLFSADLSNPIPTVILRNVRPPMIRVENTIYGIKGGSDSKELFGIDILSLKAQPVPAELQNIDDNRHLGGDGEMWVIEKSRSIRTVTREGKRIIFEDEKRSAFNFISISNNFIGAIASDSGRSYIIDLESGSYAEAGKYNSFEHGFVSAKYGKSSQSIVDLEKLPRLPNCLS